MRTMRYLMGPTVVAAIWALRRLHQQKPVDWNTFQRVTRYLKRRTQVDLDEPIAANKATHHLGRSTGDDIGELMITASKATGTEAPLATDAPYRRSGVSQ